MPRASPCWTRPASPTTKVGLFDPDPALIRAPSPCPHPRPALIRAQHRALIRAQHPALIRAPPSIHACHTQDRGIFVQNVYKEIEGKLLSLMAHHDCSRVLEKLVHVSTAYQLRTLLTQLGGKALKAVTTRHSSHVLQAMLACAARQLDRGDADVSGPLPKAAATDVTPPQPLAVLIAGFADVRPTSRGRP